MQPPKLEAEEKAPPERRARPDRHQNGEVTVDSKDERVREQSPKEERRPSLGRRRLSDKIEPRSPRKEDAPTSPNIPTPEHIIPPTPPPATTPKKKDNIPAPLNLAPEEPSDVESAASSPSQSPRSKHSPRTILGFQLRGPEDEEEEERRDFGEPMIINFKREEEEPEPLAVDSPPARKSSVPVIMVDDTEAPKKPKKKRSVKAEEPKEDASKEEGPKKPKMRPVKRAGSPEKVPEPPPSPRGRRSSICVAAEPGHVPSELVALPQTATVTIQGVPMTVEDAEKMLEVRRRPIELPTPAAATPLLSNALGQAPGKCGGLKRCCTQQGLSDAMLPRWPFPAHSHLPAAVLFLLPSSNCFTSSAAVPG